jgi:hypothetical protein
MSLKAGIANTVSVDRRRKIMNMLKDGEHIVSMTNFPRLGCVQSRQHHALRWSSP